MAEHAPPAAPSVAVILLAAGGSSRMGSPKQLLPVDGVPLVVRAARAALAAPVWPVVVVLGANREQVQPLLARDPVLIAHNPLWADGMSSSLRVGIETVEAFSRSVEAAIITLCDQPALCPAHLERFSEAFRTSGRPIIAARYASRLGAPALFSRSLFPRLRSLSGDAGARAMLVSAKEDEVLALDVPELAQDIDTPADYAAHRRSSAASTSAFRDAP